MNSHGSIRFPAFLAFFWWIAGIGFDISADSPRETEGRIVITLKDKVSVQSHVVTIADVAQISGGSEPARLKIGRLDLAEFGTSTNVSIKQKHVAFRLQLGDFPSKLFRIEGEEETFVTAIRVPVNQDGIFETAKNEALKRMPWPAEDLSVRLVQPISVTLPSVVDPKEVTMKAEPHTNNVNIGRVQMDVTVFVRGEKKMALPVYLDIRLIQVTAIARRSLAKGEVLSGDNTIADRRVIDPGVKPASAVDLAGKKLKRALGAGQIIQDTDVDLGNDDQSQTFIRNKQTVKMVVKLGAINVVANGEAMQAGKVGDRIRVQNIDSKKVVVGRIVGPDTVEVE